MRICPECGWVDPEWWRPAAFHQHIDYAQLSVLENLEPDVIFYLKKVKVGAVITIGPFVYWRSSKSKTVRRCSVEDFKLLGKSGNPQERVDHGDGKDSINLLFVNHPKLKKVE